MNVQGILQFGALQGKNLPGYNKIPASRKGVEEAIGPERKAEFKTWLKANKINWKKPESIVNVIPFITQ